MRDRYVENKANYNFMIYACGLGLGLVIVRLSDAFQGHKMDHMSIIR